MPHRNEDGPDASDGEFENRDQKYDDSFSTYAMGINNTIQTVTDPVDIPF